MNGMKIKQKSLAEAVALINDGDVVGIGGHTARRHPMALVREIARQRKRRLHIVGWNNGIDMDLLIGAGCVETVETSYIGLGSFGLAPNFRRAAEQGRVKVIEHSETTAMDRFRAASMGVAFLPSKTGLGTDMLETTPSLKEINDPFTGERWVAVQAIVPDVSIIHAHTADVYGNVQLDAQRWHDTSPDVMIARSAKRTIVSVEQIVSDEAIRARPIDTILPRVDVTCVVEAPYGAHPCCCDARYDYDLEHLSLYQKSACSAADFDRYVAEWIDAPGGHDAYLDKVGARRLMAVSMKRSSRV
jgi:glutaconate CoA-transferase subunit A